MSEPERPAVARPAEADRWPSRLRSLYWLWWLKEEMRRQALRLPVADPNDAKNAG